MVNSPCLDCPDRAPGCHNPDICSAWAEFQTALAADKKLMEDDRKIRNTLDVYKGAVLKRQKRAMR